MNSIHDLYKYLIVPHSVKKELKKNAILATLLQLYVLILNSGKSLY